MNCLKVIFFTLASLVAMSACADGPTVESTTVLGPFTGGGAGLHPDNIAPYRIAYYGTDLGFSYEHKGRIHFLFGDTWATEAYAPIEASTGARFDDGFGSIAIERWPDPALISSTNMPLIRLDQHPGSSEMAAQNPQHAMDLGKTPMGGFSNGSHEFAIFNVTKPLGCLVDADCSNGLTCDTDLGYVGVPWDEEEGLTLGCVEGAPGCAADTMTDSNGNPVPGSGLCSDTGSSAWADTDAGRVSGVGLVQRIGIRSEADPRDYTDIQKWLTNRFVNYAVRTVEDLTPAHGSGHANQNYTGAKGSGGNRRVLLWGRPGFVGVNANGLTMSLYFAYVDMPAGPGFSWNVNYYTGTRDGIPQFSTREEEAAALDLDSAEDGIQTAEKHDIAHQMTVVWIDQLKKWVMFYGGGIIKLPWPHLPTCGVLQLFAGTECQDVVVGNGAIRMRTADDPWGPWSPPQDVIAGGDPDVAGSGQYGVGGMLNHPACKSEGCAPHTQTPYYHDDEYGFFYSANIIEQWTRSAGDGVDVIWNASTWDPYRVVLFRTRINP